MASFKMLITMSTFSNVAFSDIRPMRKTCSTVGPRPPLISRLYLQLNCIKVTAGIEANLEENLLSHRIIGDLFPVYAEGDFDGIDSGQTICLMLNKHL